MNNTLLLESFHFFKFIHVLGIHKFLFENHLTFFTILEEKERHVCGITSEFIFITYQVNYY